MEAGKLTVALGGGSSKFRSFKNKGSRNDKDLVDYLKGKGVKVVFNTDELKRSDDSKPILGLFNGDHMSYETQRNKSSFGEPSLTEMTRQALNRLQKSASGYFLLVEAGRIDHAHHQNTAKLALEETLELDRAVKAALEMVDERHYDHGHS